MYWLVKIEGVGIKVEENSQKICMGKSLLAGQMHGFSGFN
jgi:hypothetical protein